MSADHLRTVLREVIESRRRRKERYFERLTAIKVDRGCAVCGECDPVVLDFHHREGAEKERKVGRLVKDDFGWARIMREIDNCDVLCANDDPRAHARQVQSWNRSHLAA